MSKPECKIIYQENQFGHVAAGNGTIALLRCPEGYELRWGGDPVWQSWAALAAAPEQQPVAVKVKPLIFDTCDIWVASGIKFIASAPAGFGRYNIAKGSQGRFSVYFGDQVMSGSYDLIDEAVEFAQSHYIGRILSAIEAKPDLAAENERLREALDTIASSFHGSNPSLAYADAPREDYLAHVLFEARQFARAALTGGGNV